MQLSTEHLFSLVEDIKTREWFEGEIKRQYKQYAQLLDKETIALLIVDELGRNTQALHTIDQIQPDGEYSVIACIQTIHDLRTFSKKNGYQGKVVNIDIADATGTSRLVLWNNDVDSIKQYNLQKGMNIKIINGYAKQGYTGETEIHLGRWGLIEVVLKQTTEPTATNRPDSIKGTLIKKEPTRAFFKDNGEFGFVSTIIIQTKEEQRTITLWDKNVKTIQQYKIGDTISITSLIQKQNNGTHQWHVTANSTIIKD